MRDGFAQELPKTAADAGMPRRRRADDAPDRRPVFQAELARALGAAGAGRERPSGRAFGAGADARAAVRSARALVDLWHADDKGDYDNSGFRYRGHQFTDAEGRFTFRTIFPALYPGRTRHYHVKVQAAGGRILTTQLYFPNEPQNRRDGLYRRELLMRMAQAGDGLAARFDFVLDMR